MITGTSLNEKAQVTSGLLEKYALVIDKGRYWGLVQLRIFRVKPEDDLFRSIEEIDEHNCSEDRLRGLLSSCIGCRAQSLFEKCGKNRYKFINEFYEKSDDTVKQYVRQLSDRCISKAIDEAAASEIHIFAGFRHPGVLYFKDELSLSRTNAVIVMRFVRDVSGIEYTVSVNGISPICKHNPSIISLTPGIVTVGNEILRLEDGLSAKLLLPFINKDTINIPSRMEGEYFRKFILKSAYKLEIEAEGFSFEDIRPQADTKIVLEQDIFGKYSLNVTFTYINRTYRPFEGPDRYISIDAGSEPVRFIRTFRDIAKEKSIMDYLKGLSLPSSTTLEEVLLWLSLYRDEITDMGIAIVQNMEKKYYIGDVRISYDEKVTGDWFKLHITLNFDDGTVLTIGDLRETLLAGEKEYLLPTGNWFIIPQSWFEKYAPILLFGYFDGNSVKVHRSQGIINTSTTGETPQYDDTVPSSLCATLRPYQQEGFKWLVSHLDTGHGCCLSDDMGLGKTIQTIALILKHKEHNAANTSSTPNPVLVVSPASVLFNWERELGRFAPTLSVLSYTGNVDMRSSLRDLIIEKDITLTTYQTLRNDIDYLSTYRFGIVVLDESQMFKNSSSQLYAAVSQIKGDFFLALSGTPIENRLSELWSLMSIITPDLLGEASTFRHQFITPISQNLYGHKSKMLRTLVTPYFLRRLKQDVLDNLPDRQDEIITCPMTQAQSGMYEKELSKTRNLILSGDSDNVSILASITKLRQMASFPGHFDSTVSSGKIDILFEYLDLLSETDHKVLLFSEYVTFLDIIATSMKQRGWDYEMLTGSTTNRENHIDHFQNDECCRFFLISLKAGGVGLNLTTADYVFLLDPWWNSSAEEQAISRAWRIGQKRSIFVYRFISQDTLEEQILKLQDKKKELIDAVLQCIT